MNRWVSVPKNSPECLPYLIGDFSEDHRALPVQRLEKSSASLLTFEIVPDSEVEFLPLWYRLWSLVRADFLILSIGPVLAISTYLILILGSAWTLDLLFALVSVVFLQIGMHGFNDYYGHLRGSDAILVRDGKLLLRDGQLKAYQVKWFAVSFISLAFAFAVPIFKNHPRDFVLLATPALFLFGVFIAGYDRWRLPWVSEIIGFLLLGPFLTLAWSQMFTQNWSIDALLIGSAFGALFALYSHLGNIADIMTDQNRGVKTSASYHGFDRSKYILGGLNLIAIFTYAVVAKGLFNALVAMASTLVLLFFHLSLFLWVLKTPSPLSSRLKMVRHWGRLIYWATLGMMLIGFWSHGLNLDL